VVTTWMKLAIRDRILPDDDLDEDDDEDFEESGELEESADESRAIKGDT